MNAEEIVSAVFALLLDQGGEHYFGEAVTKLLHAEQCAWLAQQAGADEELILAALLHDIGHLLETDQSVRDERVGVINHDTVGQSWLLSHGFSPRVAELVGSHVDAKRYLVTANREYRERLSPASQETLRLQGGAMDPDTALMFAASAGLRDKLRLRSWDESAKDPAWRGPCVHEYREMMVRHLRGRGVIESVPEAAD